MTIASFDKKSEENQERLSQVSLFPGQDFESVFWPFATQVNYEVLTFQIRYRPHYRSNLFSARHQNICLFREFRGSHPIVAQSVLRTEKLAAVVSYIS
jgi:hypothetical protein